MVSEEHFVTLVRRAMDELSPEHMAELEHVAIMTAAQPSPEQKIKLKIRGDQLLLGLYEGVPRTRRTGSESGLVPDIITIFQKPLEALARDEADLYQRIKRTVWHEIAHYYGISHDEMERRIKK